MAGHICELVNVGTEKRKGKRRRKEITVSYINAMPVGILERTLADIYARKVKNGTLAV